jgi:hypothetical protein
MPVPVLVELVNEFGHQPRAVAGESAAPYPPVPWNGTGEPPETESTIALADDLWPVFRLPDDEVRARHLSALILSSGLQPAISPTGVMTWVVKDESPDARLRAAALGALASAVVRFGWDRLGTCAAIDCADAFIDDGARAHRIYCSPTCLNRSRVRAYRQRAR